MWREFNNPARDDGLKLKHWVRVAPAGQERVTTPTEDEEGNYAFAKFNKAVDMVEYVDEEYESINVGDIGRGWTKEETDYLFQMLKRFDLRFVVVQDRWNYGTERSVEDLKERYYTVAKAVLQLRADRKGEKLHGQMAREPYNRDHEERRKAALERMMSRTWATEKEEQAVLAKATEIEERRRREAQHAHATAARLASSKGLNINMQNVAEEDIQEHTEKPIGPKLPHGKGNEPPKPGVYARKHTFIQVSNELSNAYNKGARGAKRIDQAMEEVGMRPFPENASHAVCDMWFRLRRELADLLELRRQVARKHQEMHQGHQANPAPPQGHAKRPDLKRKPSHEDTNKRPEKKKK